MGKANLSAIRKELEAATGVERSKIEDEQEYSKRLVRKVGSLSEKDWDALSPEAQDWYNEAADAMNDKKPVPTLFDGDDGKGDDTPARRRAAPKDDDDAPPEPKVGDTVRVTLTSGDDVEGEITEVDKKNIVLDIKGEEEVFRRAKVKNIKLLGGGNKAKASSDDDAPPEPKVGDTVEVTTGDGEIIKGELVEIDEKNIVIQVGKEEEVFRRAKVKVKVAAASKAKAFAKDEGDDKLAARRRGKDESDDKPARTRAGRGQDGGESDVSKAWKLMGEHMPDAKFDDMIKAVKKAGLEVKENTLEIKFRDLQKHYALFKELGLLKN